MAKKTMYNKSTRNLEKSFDYVYNDKNYKKHHSKVLVAQ